MNLHGENGLDLARCFMPGKRRLPPYYWAAFVLQENGSDYTANLELLLVNK